MAESPTTPLRCLYLDGCMYNCKEKCQDGRRNFTLEERQQLMAERASDERRKPTFDRREQRAIGYFLTLAEKAFERDRSIHGQSISYRGVVKELQREHGCYD